MVGSISRLQVVCTVMPSNFNVKIAKFYEFLFTLFVQVSSPLECFISTIQQFELPSCHSARHQNRNAFSLKKKSLRVSSWFSAVYPFQVLEDVFMRKYASSRVKRKSFYRKSELQMFLLISDGHIGVSTSPYWKVRETFPQITQKLWATKTWDLAKLFIYYSFITFHFLGFFHWLISNTLISWSVNFL